MTTKRIRIAVAVACDGQWSAAGWSKDTGENADDEALQDTAFDTLETIEEPTRTVWVEVDVPVPDRLPDVEIEGELQ